MLYLGISISILLLVIYLLFHSKKNTQTKESETALDKKPEMDTTRTQVRKLKEIRESDLPERLTEVLKDKYKDVTPISVGGMGVVASAWDFKNKRKVAVKTVLPDLENDPQAIKLFFAECNAIQKMNHPNIVKILEVSEGDILYYYVMEFLEGENLSHLIRRMKKIPLETVIKIGTQVARGIQHCHDNKVIHRDIKPSNIFITLDGTVKIIDFGIVKMLTSDLSISKSTTKIGSPEFASPEQIQGQKISGKCDIYSLGVCLFNMLSGTMPYKTTDLFAKMFDSPMNIKEVCPETPEPLAEIINNCIQLDPAKRYTAMQLWQKLKALHIN